MSTKDYYATTVYNSKYPRKIDKKPIGIEQAPRHFKLFRQRSLPNVKFPELFLLDILYIEPFFYIFKQRVSMLKKWSELENKSHEIIFRSVFKNIAETTYFISSLLGFMPYLCLFSLIFVFVVFFIKGMPLKLDPFLQYAFYLIVMPYVLSKIGRFVSRYLPDKKYEIFNRRTGMVSFPRKKKDLVIPFDEFDPYVVTRRSPSGRAYQTLWYMHRYSTFGMCVGMNESWPAEMLLTHQYYQQFMDISKPLPDVPKLEDYRHLDPVTAEYDRKTGRPKDYWKSKTKEEIDKMLADIRKETKKINELQFFDTR